MGAYIDVIDQIYTRISSQTANGKILDGLNVVYKGWRSQVLNNTDELPAVVIRYDGTAEDAVDTKRGPDGISMYCVIGIELDLICRDDQTGKDSGIDKTTHILTWLEKLHDSLYNDNTTDKPSINLRTNGRPQMRITGISDIQGDDIQKITTSIEASTVIYTANNRRA